ncbi:MAG: hypothetical protein ACW99Q_17470 [Candidatus Kariarchaeaceae archaeon]|jgi:hypothetical protein
MPISTKNKHWIINTRFLGRVPDEIPFALFEEITLWKDDKNFHKHSSGWFIDLLLEIQLNNNGVIKYDLECKYVNFTYEGLEAEYIELISFIKLFSFDFHALQIKSGYHR